MPGSRHRTKTEKDTVPQRAQWRVGGERQVGKALESRPREGRSLGSWDTQEGVGHQEWPVMVDVLGRSQAPLLMSSALPSIDSFSWGDKLTPPGALLRRTGRPQTGTPQMGKSQLGISACPRNPIFSL